MGNEKRSLQVVDSVDPTAGRYARYDQQRTALERQADRVQALLKTLIITVIGVVGALLVLVGGLTALFGNLHTFLETSSAFMQLTLKWFLPAVVFAVAVFLLKKLYGAWKAYTHDHLVELRMREEINEIKAEIKREDKRVDADVAVLQADAAVKRAEAAERQARAQQLLMTLPVDEQGNLVYRNPMTGELVQVIGQMRQHPNLSSLHYSNKIDGPKAEQAMLNAPGQGEIAKPTIEEIVQVIVRNSFEFVLGRSLQSRELIKIELPDAHIKLIGGSRMGKSCEAGAIIDQACQTHDPQYLLIAALDLEYKTSRLFENDPHILTIKTGYKQVKMHAKNVAQVAEHLVLLHELMLYRYELTDAQLEKEPHVLIYLEEFLYWKKLLGQFVSPDLREKALDAFAGIATRGLKVGLHLMACAQVDYADDELRDAMAQFLAVNVAFSVRPSAATAAGFVNTELLKRNYAARTPGQFVVESIGGSDIGVAPDYDVRAKLKALTTVDTEPIKALPETQPNASRTTGRIETNPALQAKVEEVMQNSGENMNECLLRVWGARPGDNNKYKAAKQEYMQVQEIIHSMARKAMQAYQSQEMESE